MPDLPLEPVNTHATGAVSWAAEKEDVYYGALASDPRAQGEPSGAARRNGVQMPGRGDKKQTIVRFLNRASPIGTTRELLAGFGVRAGEKDPAAARAPAGGVRLGDREELNGLAAVELTLLGEERPRHARSLDVCRAEDEGAASTVGSVPSDIRPASYARRRGTRVEAPSISCLPSPSDRR